MLPSGLAICCRFGSDNPSIQPEIIPVLAFVPPHIASVAEKAFGNRTGGLEGRGFESRLLEVGIEGGVL